MADQPVSQPSSGRFANWPHWTMFLLVASLLLLVQSGFSGIAAFRFQ